MFRTKRELLLSLAMAGLLGQAAMGQATLSITGNFNPTRAWAVSYVAQSDPAGLPIDQFSWSYAWNGGANTHVDSDSDGDDKSVWPGRMVISGTISCSAVVSGSYVTVSLPVSVKDRTWTVPITCVEDNEADWGSEPTSGVQMGVNRDRDSDVADVFVPRDSDGNWTSAFTVAQVPTGPCYGWWYVSSSTLKCQRETVINRYLKADGPALGGYTFQEANANLACFTTTPADFLTAVMAHEYRGTPATAKSLEGHFGRIERSILDTDKDAKKHIESIVRQSVDDLRFAVNNAIAQDEGAVEDFGGDEEYMATYGPNWGLDLGSQGVGQNSRWDGSASWTTCVNNPANF